VQIPLWDPERDTLFPFVSVKVYDPCVGLILIGEVGYGECKECIWTLSRPIILESFVIRLGIKGGWLFIRIKLLPVPTNGTELGKIRKLFRELSRCFPRKWEGGRLWLIWGTQATTAIPGHDCPKHIFDVQPGSNIASAVTSIHVIPIQIELAEDSTSITAR